MDAIKAYLEKIKDIPLLTDKQEKELIRKAKKGSRRAIRKIINSNLKLVVNIAKHYSHYGLPLMDLIEEGNLGLIRAIGKFKPSKGYRFSTYATWWIKQAVTRALTEQSRLIRIPVYMEEFISKYLKVRDGLTQKLGREPTRLELSKKMRMPQKRIAEIEMWMGKKISLEDHIPGGDEKSQISDFIEERGRISNVRQINGFIKHEEIEELFSRLSDREARILDMRFGISDKKPATLAQVSRKFKISRERVRQIEKQALAKLKKIIKEQKLSFAKNQNIGG